MMMRDCKAIRASFWHGYRVGTDQDVISMEDPKAMEVLEIDLRNCLKVWEPQSLLLNYDEIRVAGWEPLPDGATLTPGQLLARHLQALTARVRKLSPQTKLYTWSDMFTPHHNARGDKPLLYGQRQLVRVMGRLAQRYHHPQLVCAQARGCALLR